MKTRIFTRRKTRSIGRSATAEPRSRRTGRADSGKADSGARGRLRDLCGDLLATVVAFRAAPPSARPPYRNFRAEIEDLLGEFERRTAASGGDPEGFARFALVALADETAMNAEWDGAAEWARDALQLEYFENLTAGEVFFERLDELQSGGDPAVLEIFYLCLCSGFRGRYRNDPDTLDSIRNRLFRRLGVADARHETHLTEEAYGRDLERPLMTRRFPFAWALPFVLGAVGLYVAYFVILERQVEEIRSSGSPSVASPPAQEP